MVEGGNAVGGYIVPPAFTTNVIDFGGQVWLIAPVRSRSPGRILRMR